MTDEPFAPNWTIPPGQTLKDALAERGITDQYAAAKLLGLRQQYVSRLYRGTMQLTPRLAIKLESLGLGNAEFWVRREALYRLDIERGKPVIIESRRGA